MVSNISKIEKHASLMSHSLIYFKNKTVLTRSFVSFIIPISKNSKIMRTLNLKIGNVISRVHHLDDNFRFVIHTSGKSRQKMPTGDMTIFSTDRKKRKIN